MSTALRKTVSVERRAIWLFGGLMTVSFLGAALVGAAGCGSTQFHEEGPGQPDGRTYGAVPAGMVGVCKRPFSMQPEVVSDVMWEHAEECHANTPKDFLRIGYGNLNNEPDKARAKHKRIMEALRQGEEDNIAVLNVLRAVRDEALDDPWLKDRVSRESARPEACDFSYLLGVMHDRSIQLRPGSDPCAVYAYDQADRQEICMFDTEVQQAVWLSSSWACMTRTGTMGKGESCHKLCAFDDYCSKQVSCAQADIDLALCALGVCLPEPDVMSE